MRLFDPIPLRALPPNAITAASMALGLASVYVSLVDKNFALAAWFVLLSVLLDKLDGSVARWVRGSSEFGVQFDSFSDATAFGIAPGALVFAAAQTYLPQQWGSGAVALGLPAPGVLAAICLTYAVMTAVRLARFNVTTAAIGPMLFLGLPSTLSGAVIASSYLTLVELGLDKAQPQLLGWFPWLMAVNAALMVCNLPLPKLKASKVLPIKLFQMLSGLYVFVAVPLRAGMPGVLVLVLGYLLVGFLWLGPRMYAQRIDLHTTHG